MARARGLLPLKRQGARHRVRRRWPGPVRPVVETGAWLVVEKSVNRGRRPRLHRSRHSAASKHCRGMHQRRPSKRGSPDPPIPRVLPAITTSLAAIDRGAVAPEICRRRCRATFNASASLSAIGAGAVAARRRARMPACDCVRSVSGMVTAPADVASLHLNSACCHWPPVTVLFCLASLMPPFSVWRARQVPISARVATWETPRRDGPVA